MLLAHHIPRLNIFTDYSDNLQSVVTIPPEYNFAETTAIEQPTPEKQPEYNDEPSASTLPADILEVLGQPKNKAEVFAPKTSAEIAERWSKIVIDGLNKESKQKFMENILIPENLKFLKAPVLNQEIYGFVGVS